MSRYSPSAAFGNAFYLTTGLGVEAVLQLLFLVFASRLLGPEEFGYFGYLIAIFTFVVVILNWGVPANAVREMVQQPQDADTIWASAFRIRGTLGIVLFICGLIFSFTEPEPARRAAVWMVFAYGLFVPLDLAPVFDARKLSRWDVPGKLGGRLAGVAALILLWQIKGNLTVVDVAACSLLVLIVNVAIGWKVAQHLGINPGLWRAPADTWRMVRTSTQIVWQGLMPTIYQFSVPVLVRWLSTESQTGYYSLTTRLVIPVFLFKGILARWLLPLVSETAQDRALTERRIERIIPVMLLVFGLVSALGIPSVEVLLVPLFGVEYAAAVLPTQIVLSHFVVTGAAFLFGQTIYAAGNPIPTTLSTTVGCVVTLSFCLFLIPSHGAIGAAWSSWVGEIAAALILLPLFYRRYRPRLVARSLRIVMVLALGPAIFYGPRLFGVATGLSMFVLAALAIGVALLLTGEISRLRAEFRRTSPDPATLAPQP